MDEKKTAASGCSLRPPAGAAGSPGRCNMRSTQHPHMCAPCAAGAQAAGRARPLRARRTPWHAPLRLSDPPRPRRPSRRPCRCGRRRRRCGARGRHTARKTSSWARQTVRARCAAADTARGPKSVGGASGGGGGGGDVATAVGAAASTTRRWRRRQPRCLHPPLRRSPASPLRRPCGERQRAPR